MEVLLNKLKAPNITFPSLNTNSFQMGKLFKEDAKQIQMGKPFMITENSFQYYDRPKPYKKFEVKIVFINGQRKVVISEKEINPMQEFIKDLSKKANDLYQGLKKFWHEYCEHNYKYSEICEEKREEENVLKLQGGDFENQKCRTEDSSFVVEENKNCFENLKNLMDGFACNISNGLIEYGKLCSEHLEYFDQYTSQYCPPSMVIVG